MNAIPVYTQLQQRRTHHRAARGTAARRRADARVYDAALRAVPGAWHFPPGIVTLIFDSEAVTRALSLLAPAGRR